MQTESGYPVRFRVLGPVEASLNGGAPVFLPPKPKALLAVLLLETGRRVRQERLISALWPERVPPSAPRVIRTYVSLLRRSLCLSSLYSHGGYRLEVAPGELDVLLFQELAAIGRRALGGGDAVTASRLLNQALRLWRGDPAEDITVDKETDVLLAGLAEQRLLAEEDMTEAELCLGNEAGLIARLRLLVTAHPLRERLWGQLMTALYRCGQQAAALAAYRQLHAHLVAELGIDPNPQLRELHQEILAGGPVPGRATRPAPAILTHIVPRQLPPDISHFTGRSAELDRLDGLLAVRPEAGPVASISGTAGAGKTALAVHWAHRTAGQFPDGQLYASLRPVPGAWAADPLDVLARFLRALRIAPELVPANLDEAAAMYRSLLHGKQLIVVLDNAASSEQVRPLLPGAGGSVVIVTSRARLLGLCARDGATQVPLPPLPPAEAVRLLHRILGAQRADAEPLALSAIAGECAFLPLALRIAAEKAKARTAQPLAGLAAQLADARGKLDVLATDDPATSLRTALSWSYHSLAPDAARMFRLLGLHPGPEIGVPAAAALADCGPRQAAHALAVLADGHLTEEAAAGRYRFHDLLRACAVERAEAEETAASRANAIRRVYTWYLRSADAAGQLLRSSPLPLQADGTLLFGTYEQALTWYDTERPNIVAAIDAAADYGESEIGRRLRVSLATCADRRDRRRWLAGHL